MLGSPNVSRNGLAKKLPIRSFSTSANDLYACLDSTHSKLKGTTVTTAQDPIAQLTSRLQLLEDIAAIQRLKTRYASCADTLFRASNSDTVKQLLAMFTEDSTLDLGPFGQYAGHKAIEDALSRVLPVATAWSTHYVLNHEIDVHGDTAEARSYLLLQMQARSPEGAPPTPAVLVHGQYEDRCIRTADGWKFSAVRAILEPPR